MVGITFPDSETKALGLLLGRFSGTLLKSGDPIVPEAALAQQNIVFTTHGNASYDQQIAVIRNAAARSVQ